MSESSITDGVTLASVVVEIAALREESSLLKAETASLRVENASHKEEIEELRVLVRAREAHQSAQSFHAQADLSMDAATEGSGGQGHPVSRRGALRALGGAAAGGVGLAIGSTLLGAEPVAAAGTVTLGAQNNETSTTNFTNTTDKSNALTGVASSNAAGVHGILGNATGINMTAAGVLGETDTNSPGVLGLCDGGGGWGVYGKGTDFSEGVHGEADQGAGVVGSSNSVDFAAIVAENFASGPALLLQASGTSLPSDSAPGSFIVLSDGSLWYTPSFNQWTQLNKGFTNLLANPIRVFDSRNSGNPADPNRVAGEVAANSITTLQITGVTVDALSVPAGAAAVVGNVTIYEPAGDGFLTLYPAAGGAPPNISNLNYQVGDIARANFCVVALNASGKLDVYAQAQSHLIFDVTGYIF